jgi:predicted PurR-regulated permease PerM
MSSVPESTHPRAYVSRILDASINIGFAAVLVISCLLILRPFVPLLAWGIIIAVASYPRFQKIERRLGGRGVLAAILWTLFLLLLLIAPIFLLGREMAESVQPVYERLHAGTLSIPPPPPGIESWPLIGSRLSSLWSAASQDLSQILIKFAPQLREAIPGILSASAAIGITVVQFFFAILVAGALLANAPAAARLTRSLAIRIFGQTGPEYQRLIGSTIRSVTFGILGVALIQSAAAALGFLVVGMPGAGIWSVLFLVAAILQVGALVLIPPLIYIFATASTTKAVIFLVWCGIVALMDNVLKPLLLGRGAEVPIVVVFLGAIGGFVAMGIVGLFVGATVLCVGYKLFLAWIGETAEPHLLTQNKSA